MRRLLVAMFGIGIGCGGAGAETPAEAFVAELKAGYAASDLQRDYRFWMTASECKQPLPSELLSFLKARIRGTEVKLPKERQEAIWHDVWSNKKRTGTVDCATVEQLLTGEYQRHLELEKQGKNVPPKPDF